MDYEKKYKEALERARQALDKIQPENHGVIKLIKDAFPELKESDEERIRKEIVGVIQKHYPNTPESYRWISWLEKQKEQKPEQYSPLCDTIKDKIREYIANHFIADTVVKTDIKSIVKAMEEGVRLGKEEQKLVNLPAGFYVTLPDGKKYYTKEMRCNGMNVKVVEPKPAEWSDEDEKALDMCLDAIPKKWKTESGILLTKWLKDNIHPQPKQEWSEEDELTIADLINYFEGDSLECSAEEMVQRIKSIRPSWKPSEEQIGALNYAYCELFKRGDVEHNILGPLQKLCDELKKLM